MNTQNRKTRGGLLAAVVVAGFVSMPAAAQMFEQPYSNRTTDRAGLAIVMKQVDSGMFDSNRNSSSVVAGSGQGVLVCGGTGSDASATANSSCIILGDGASGTVNLGQTADGDQAANTTSTQTQNNNAGGAAEIEEILAGGG